MNIIYKSPFNHQLKVVSSESLKEIPIDELKRLILYKEDLLHLYSHIDFNVLFNGKKITDNLYINDFNVFIQISLSLNGGKGGFGSMLRAIGAQIEKTTNREACRDLSGRRLRDVNEEKRIKEWIKKQSQRKEEEKKKKEKLKRIAEGTVSSKCDYNDVEFEKFRTEIPDIVEESITQGLKHQNSYKQDDNSNLKRKLDQKTNDDVSNFPSNSEDTQNKTLQPPPKKLAKKHDLWLGIEADSDSDSENEIQNITRKN